jgi:putative transposase
VRSLRYPIYKPMQTRFRELSDSHWQIVQKIIGPQRASKHSPRTMLNAMLFLLRTGTQWRNLPPHFPPWPSVYYHFRRWQQTGQWQALLDQLVHYERQRLGYGPVPDYVVLDSQSVKSAPMLKQTKGFDGFKRIRGRKRHVLVDEAGLPLALHIGPANQGDSKAAQPLLSRLAARTPYRPLLLVDAVYPHTFVSWAAEQLAWPVEVLSKPQAHHFVVVARRWVVERSFGWLCWYRRLSVDHEKTVASAEAMLRMAFIGIILNRMT